MKYIITESQYKKLMEQEEEEKVLHIPDVKVFGGWDGLQKFLEKKGNPPYTIDGGLFFDGTPIKSLGNLQSVGGTLFLFSTPLKDLGKLKSVGGDLDLWGTKIKSLEDLQTVGGYLNLTGTKIVSLGNLKSVGGDLDLVNTPLSRKYSEEQIRQMVDVGGDIYL